MLLRDLFLDLCRSLPHPVGRGLVVHEEGAEPHIGAPAAAAAGGSHCLGLVDGHRPDAPQPMTELIDASAFIGPFGVRGGG